MNVKTLAAIVFCCFACVALGDAQSDIKKVTERFYDQYRDAAGAVSIQKSKYFTPEFKAAYQAHSFQHGDPIVCAQDFPSNPYRATAISVQGETATVKMVAGDWSPLNVSLVLRNGTWLINGINDLKGK